MLAISIAVFLVVALIALVIEHKRGYPTVRLVLFLVLMLLSLGTVWVPSKGEQRKTWLKNKPERPWTISKIA